MKHKLFILLITLFLLSFLTACGGGGGDTLTTNTTSTTTVDDACWQRVYNECVETDNDVWTCNDLANETCGN